VRYLDSTLIFNKEFKVTHALFFAGIGMLFFILQHDLFWAKNYQEFGHIHSDVAIKVVAAGSMTRQIVYIFIAILFLVSFVQNKQRSLIINAFIGWFLILFFLWSICSISWSSDPLMTFRRLVVSFIIMFSALVMARQLSLFQIIFLTIFVCGLYLVTGIIMEISLGVFHPLKESYRFCGTIDPNIGSWSWALLLIGCYFLYKSGYKYKKTIAALFAVSLVFVLLSKTRTTVISLILALSFYSFLTKNKSRVFIAILIFAWLGCFSFFLLGDQLSNVLWNGILLGRDDTHINTLTGRVPVWIATLPYIKDRLFLGYGYNSFWNSLHVEEVSKIADWGGTAVTSALNGYIDLVLGVGIIGTILFIVFYIMTICRSIYLYFNTKNLYYAFIFVTLIYFALVSFTESPFYDTGFAGLILNTLICKISFCEKEL
jgi:exopolysaccharide production protein ExoQ